MRPCIRRGSSRWPEFGVAQRGLRRETEATQGSLVLSLREFSVAQGVGAHCQHQRMGRIFIGTEALAGGAVTRHELARRHTRIYPDVYCPNQAELSLKDRIYAAWLWSRRRAVIGDCRPRRCRVLLGSMTTSPSN